jgi:hypothetical protein
MTRQPALALRTYSLEQVKIEDERSFRHVELYADLKEVLRRAGYAFRVLPQAMRGRWDRALLLNLTFWGTDAGGDVLVDRALPADVVAHAAWHHLAAQALRAAPTTPLPPAALFLGESIASAFDVYLVGRLLGRAPTSSFLETQVPAMAEAAQAAGLSSDGFATLLQSIAEDPARAFAELRELLFDASMALLASQRMEDALAALARADAHRFGPLLHRYELSNWVLYARAYGRRAATVDARTRTVDRALRETAEPLDWLTAHWVAPALADKTQKMTTPAPKARALSTRTQEHAARVRLP